MSQLKPLKNKIPSETMQSAPQKSCPRKREESWANRLGRRLTRFLFQIGIVPLMKISHRPVFLPRSIRSFASSRLSVGSLAPSFF